MRSSAHPGLRWVTGVGAGVGVGAGFGTGEGGAGSVPVPPWPTSVDRGAEGEGLVTK